MTTVGVLAAPMGAKGGKTFIEILKIIYKKSTRRIE